MIVLTFQSGEIKLKCIAAWGHHEWKQHVGGQTQGRSSEHRFITLSLPLRSITTTQRVPLLGGVSLSDGLWTASTRRSGHILNPRPLWLVEAFCFIPTRGGSSPPGGPGRQLCATGTARCMACVGLRGVNTLQREPAAGPALCPPPCRATHRHCCRCSSCICDGTRKPTSASADERRAAAAGFVSSWKVAEPNSSTSTVTVYLKATQIIFISY